MEVVRSASSRDAEEVKAPMFVAQLCGMSFCAWAIALPLWLYSSSGTVFFVLSIVALVICVLPLFAFGAFAQVDSVSRRLNHNFCPHCTAAVYLVVAAGAILAAAQIVFDDGSKYFHYHVDVVEDCSVSDLGQIANDYSLFFCKDGQLGGQSTSERFTTSGRNAKGIGLTVGAVNDPAGNAVAVAVAWTSNPNPHSMISGVGNINLPMWQASTQCNGHAGLCGRTETNIDFGSHIKDRARALAISLNLGAHLPLVDVAADLSEMAGEGLGRLIAGFVLLVIAAPVCFPLCVFRLASRFLTAAPGAVEQPGDVVGLANDEHVKQDDEQVIPSGASL